MAAPIPMVMATVIPMGFGSLIRLEAATLMSPIQRSGTTPTATVMVTITPTKSERMVCARLNPVTPSTMMWRNTGIEMATTAVTTTPIHWITG